MISNRLKSVAGMVTKGYTVADIGTDHGYVPIYLIKHDISPKVYAMDINSGPLKIARANVENEGFEDRIIIKQANGMKALEPGRAESVIISGMGGELIVQILKESKVNDMVKEFILSPHKNPEVLRKYLIDNNYKITEEIMLKDSGKYYTIMKAVHGTENTYEMIELLYGRKLIEERNRTLREYLEIEEKKFSKIYNEMRNNGSKELPGVEQKLKNIRKTLEKIEKL